MLADMLSEFGHCVDGPYNRLSDAMFAAKSNNVHAGVQDVNIGGEEIYARLTYSPSEKFRLFL